MLMMVGLDLDDEAATAALLEANAAAMTGPTAIVTTVVRELELLLDHPRLGPLIRTLTLWTTSHLTAGRYSNMDSAHVTLSDGGHSQ
jgi:hypothetical protein